MPATRRQPRLSLLVAALAVLSSLAICTAAILAHAPAAAVVPVVAVVCVGCPMFASWEMPIALSSLRAQRGQEAMATLRKSLDKLPEVEHPLGF